jgi:AraC-like DNA-binding protein
MWHSANLHQLLDDVVTYQWAISENGGFEPHVEPGDRASETLRVYEYVPVSNAIPANRHQILTVVSSVVRSIRRITRGAVDVVSLRVPSTLDAREIGRHLGCGVVSTDGNAAIVLRERDLDLPIAHRDAQLYELVRGYAEALHQRTHHRRTLVEEIKTCVRNNGFASTSLAVVESEMGLHRRILQRMLADESTCFRELKEEVVRDEAVRRLALADASITSISMELGYSEPSAFHRAFRKWFGITPGRFSRSDFYAL